jgi:hypothetical protein
MLAKEPECAKAESETTGRHFSALFDNLTPNDLAHRSIASMDDSGDDPAKLSHRRREMEQLVEGLRDMHDALLTQPMMIETLIENEIDTREYITRITSEKEQPLLLLPRIQ